MRLGRCYLSCVWLLRPRFGGGTCCDIKECAERTCSDPGGRGRGTGVSRKARYMLNAVC